MALRGLKGGGYVTYKALEQAGLSDADVAGKTKDEVDAIEYAADIARLSAFRRRLLE